MFFDGILFFLLVVVVITNTSAKTESPNFQPFAIYDLMATPGMTLSDDFEVYFL
jgi:hypothetical protein